ncbi:MULTISPECIES: DUF881 domain-containing protein [Clostridium]|uniref:DUF881 domain-containing protein n=1 Tax=Clostridium paridis TaxID=2803863 RepID=A0A937K3R0_9CLOT|nr:MULTISPECIES: DUF881 domain-containing protein [Clostridium]MBL4931049.1 DUF881 domain-containing protein [Clostridium paridis]
MKKIYSQLAVAVVCALLGFLLSYQFKLISNKEKSTQQNYNQTDVLAEIEQLKKERDDANKRNGDLQDQLKKIEDASTNSSNLDKQLKKDLDDTRMITGSIDVKGTGITLYINPKKDIFSTQNDMGNTALGETDLVHIVNNLLYAGAEAIAINDYRITPQTGIKFSNNYIWIGSEGKVDPKTEIVVKAVGDKAKLQSILNFGGTLEVGSLHNYNKKIVPEDEIVINKSTKGLNTNFIKPVK